MFYNEDHLKVETPQTTDGINLIISPLTGKVQFKTTYLPLSAKKSIDIENKALPENLKHRITVLPGRTQYVPAPKVDESAALREENERLKALLAGTQEDTVPRGPGRPRKTETNENN